MTITQLRTFALVARLGSMRAAAAALGVSEPAVSAAVAALRSDLGDALLVRAAGGLALTSGGRRLAAHAEEIVGLADRVRREVAATASSEQVLTVAVSRAFEEHAAPALVEAFARRSPGTVVHLQHRPVDRLAGGLVDRSVDVVLGQRPNGVDAGGSDLEVVAFLRYTRVLLCAPEHPLAAAPVSRAALASCPWWAGPDGVEEGSAEARWLMAGPLPTRLTSLSSEADALAAARAGQGVVLALRHVVRHDLARGTLVQLAVPGTPVTGMWFASTLAHGRSAPAARALLRFVTTPDATSAMVAAHEPRRPAPVRVSLWS